MVTCRSCRKAYMCMEHYRGDPCTAYEKKTQEDIENQKAAKEKYEAWKKRKEEKQTA